MYRPTISTFIVWLGLNTELRGEVDGYSTHVSTGAGPEAEHEASLRGDYEHTGFSVTVYDNAFEGYSRPGTSTVMLFCMSGWEPWRRFEGDFVAGDRAAYEEQKERWSESLIRRAEELVIRGLSSMIEVKVTASPLTNWAYTANTEGAIYGFEQSMDNAYMTRIQNETPVPRRRLGQPRWRIRRRSQRWRGSLHCPDQILGTTVIDTASVEEPSELIELHPSHIDLPFIPAEQQEGRLGRGPGVGVRLTPRVDRKD